jgi:hypothetical protein
MSIELSNVNEVYVDNKKNSDESFLSTDLMKMKKDELRNLANKKGIEIKSKDTKEIIIKRIKGEEIVDKIRNISKEKSPSKLKSEMSPPKNKKSDKIIEMINIRLDKMIEYLDKKFSEDYEDQNMKEFFSKICTKHFKGLKDEIFDELDKKSEKSSIKNPYTSFTIFSKDKRQEIKDANPEMRFSDISKALGNKWKIVGEDEKKEYEERAVEDKQRFVKEVEDLEDCQEKEKLMEKVKKIKEGSPKKSAKRQPKNFIENKVQSEEQDRTKVLKKMTVTQLKDLAISKDVTYISKIKKDDLINLIIFSENKDICSKDLKEPHEIDESDSEND